MSRLKLVALGAVGLVAVLGVVAVALLSRGNADEERVVAVIEGIEITEGEWERSLAQPHEWADCVREKLDDYDGPEADEQGRALTLLADLEAGHSPEARTLGMMLMTLAPVAEARERGLEPTDAEVAEEVEMSREITTSILEGQGSEAPPTACLRERIETEIAEVGEDRYWNEVVREEERRSLLVENLWGAEDVGAAGGGTYAFELARSADVELRSALEGVVTLDEAYAFLDHYEQLAEESNAARERRNIDLLPE